MFEQACKNIDDILWKEAGCTTELDYTEQTSWLLFLKYLDGLEQDLSVKNPNGGEEVKHRSPEAIMDEIAALDAESAGVLTTIRKLL
jgi:hypothetical protein